MIHNTHTTETTPTAPVNPEVLAQGQTALAELCALEVPLGTNGTGSLEGSAPSFNELDLAQHLGGVVVANVYTANVHDILRARMMAQKENRLTINALRGLREINIARQEKDAPEHERQYGLTLLVTSKGTIVDGAVYRHDGYGHESTHELKDAADLGDKEWQTLATAAAEVREGKMRLAPQPYTRSRYPFGLSDHFFHKAQGIAPR